MTRFQPCNAGFSPARVFVFILLTSVLLTGLALAQAPAPKSPPEKSKLSASRDQSAETPGVLIQLSGALESLAAKVSPAVVQILVTGYGQLNEQDRSQTAFIVRQQAVGSGVIVDAHGYIMTNAHVVEGAQRIRVALPLMGDGSGQVPVGKRRVLEARLVGQHKETDLALLKVDQTDLPTLSLVSQERSLSAVPKACKTQSPWACSARSRASPIPASRSPICRPTLPSIPATAAARWSI